MQASPSEAEGLVTCSICLEPMHPMPSPRAGRVQHAQSDWQPRHLLQDPRSPRNRHSRDRNENHPTLLMIMCHLMHNGCLHIRNANGVDLKTEIRNLRITLKSTTRLTIAEFATTLCFAGSNVLKNSMSTNYLDDLHTRYVTQTV